jgi:hypothetical protein
VIVVAVRKEHGGNVAQVAPDPGQKPPQPAARKPGVYEETPSAGL